MFLFLSKLVPPFVYPVGSACLLLILALVLTRPVGHSKTVRIGWLRATLILALLTLWLGSNRWVATSLARSLEWRYLPPGEAPQGDVIVLLGGSGEAAEYPRPIVEINGAGDRIIYTAWLYNQGKAPYVLVSGGLLDWISRPRPPAQDEAELLQMMGVPQDAIWLQPESHNTYEDALFCAEILKEKGIRRILLVTSASHMPRSVALFQAQGLDVIPLPVDYTVTEIGWQALTHGDLRSQVLGLLPTSESLAVTTRILKEYLGMLVYDLKGWYR